MALTTEEINAQYEKREAAIRILVEKTTITAADLVGLDRLGRFQVASGMWLKCDETARQALLADQQAQVRSTASLSHVGIAKPTRWT